LLIAVIAVVTSSCGAYFNQPVDFQDARIGETSKVTNRLEALPTPEEPIVVGVYNFRDLTGQYKPSNTGSTFSTAVTQGATSILIKALEDSKWFTAIERENIGNLLNERNIIRSTRQEYTAGNNTQQTQLPPLLYAGILLEGGIVSYDTNVMTGGLGARYFGVGGSTEYRQDRITIYLRAISTSSGKILKNIYISKTILSQAVDASLFRYVNFQRLLEVETGFTRNEPVQMAVKEAIEKAVEGLVLEGIEDDLWKTKDGKESVSNILVDYKAEKDESGLTKLYNRKFVDRPYNNSVGVGLGSSLINGDYNDQELGAMIKLDYTTGITPYLAINMAANAFELRNNNRFSEKFIGLDANALFRLLPNDDLSPYAWGGAGFITGLSDNDVPDNVSTTHFKLQYGLGLEYLINSKIGIKAFAEHNISLDDEVDYLDNGKRNDFYYNFGIGINFYFGKSNK